MEMVKLKTGKTLPLPVVRGVLHSFTKMMEESDRFIGPVVFYELVQKARNPEHEFFGEVAQHLGTFIDGSGKIQTTIRDIILACVEGDDLEMTIVDPVKS